MLMGYRDFPDRPHNGGSKMLKRSVYHEDRLVRRFRPVEWGKPSFHGKRVSKDCPLNKAEVRAYVTGGALAAIKLIATGRNIGLREAKDLLDKARGTVRRPV
jgi:hypothetical protein